MKFIIKKFMSDETIIELKINDPSKLTVGEFANLFFEQLSQKQAYSIEPSKFTDRNDILPEDFNFFYNGKKFTSSNDRAYGFSISNKNLSNYIPVDQNECIVYANLSVYSKLDYLLNSHLNIFSRTDALGNQLTDLQTSTLKGFVGFKK